MLGKRIQAIVFCIIAVLICVANLVGGTGCDHIGICGDPRDVIAHFNNSRVVQER